MAKPFRKKPSREIRDIRFPTSYVPEKPGVAERPIRRIHRVDPPVSEPVISSRKTNTPRVVLLTLASILLVVIAGAFWYRGEVKKQIGFRDLLSDIFRADRAINIPVASSSITLPSSLEGWLSLFKRSFTTIGFFKDASFGAFSALSHTEDLLQELPDLILKKDGPGTVSNLLSLRENLHSLSSAVSALPHSSEYFSYASDIERAETVIQSLLGLLQAPGERHVLVLFGNSAELRPGGGFLGSFADITFGSSTIYDIRTRDVNEVDRGLAANIVPPKPLQGLVTRWRAADANWFFDYAVSAQKTLEMMSRSSLYPAGRLEGAILISPRVIEDILTVTGPLELPESDITITSENVSAMIQKEVQDGQANGETDPKRVLSEIVSGLEVKMTMLPSESRQEILGFVGAWINDKNLQIFMKDPTLARVLAYYHLNGSLYATPQKFSGDYLAVVNANVGGGKSDAFISDSIEIETDLRADGVVHDRLIVRRTSNATAADEWWYRVTNQDYLQVFTPLGSTLMSSTGGRSREITPRSSYTGFERDADVVALEATLAPVPAISSVSQSEQSGKNVFASWITTPAGATASFTMEYRRDLREPFRDNDTYTFVYERQSGAKQSLQLILHAPPGFIWQESGSTRYQYSASATTGRVVLQLTLKAI